MTEDVLEQVVDDWLRRRGYFTRTNVRFGPEPGDDGYVRLLHNQKSDLDVIAVNPTISGPEGVLAISCKAMQQGFSPNGWLKAAEEGRKYNGKLAWKHMRELWDPTWAAALHRRVRDLTGADTYTYVLAVTRLGKGGSADTAIWHAHPIVGPNLHGLSSEVWTFAKMWSDLTEDVSEQIEPSHIGRLAQLLKASELDGPH